MTHLVFFHYVQGSGYSDGEGPHIAYLANLPQAGDALSMGEARLWSVLAVDHYSNLSKPQLSIYIAHVSQEAELPRSAWFWNQSAPQRPIDLKLCITDGLLLSSGILLSESGRPVPGTLLPEYNVESHRVSSRPWGIDSVEVMTPSNVAEPYYRNVYLARCVSVPEAQTTSLELAQTI
jgi:hypothetical protein